MSQSLPESAAEWATLNDLLRWRAHYQSNQQGYTFLVDGETQEQHLTYGELDAQARAIGALLQSMDATGERVLLLYPPGLEYVAAFFGCLYAGAVAVPSYPPRLNRPDPRLQAIVADSQAALALATSSILSSLERRFDHTPELAALKWSATDELAGDLAAAWQEPEVNGDSLAFLQYTSGSTAAPKGVALTHGNLLHNSALIHGCFGHTPASRGVIWLPPYHDMGLIGGIIQPLYGSLYVVLMSPLAFLQQPLRWLRAITRYRATTSGGPNFAYDLCVIKIAPEQRAELDLSSWDLAFNGAEPVRTETMERFAAFFAPCGFRREAFYPCYGLAEATLIASGGQKAARPIVREFQATALEQKRVVRAAPEEKNSRTLVGCGQSLPDQQIVIADPESLIHCSPDQVGEIWVSGPSIAQGYWNRPQETAHTFGACLADSGQGPFLRTGDLGFLQDGELFIAGRIKDLIIIRGRNHYPQDIELTVERSHPALQPGSGAAFSVDVADEERLVVVQEVRRTHRKADVDEVARAIRQAVFQEHELQVYGVVLIKPVSLPKTSSGKVQRHLCRAQFLEGSLRVIGSNILQESPVVPGVMPGDERLSRGTFLALEPEERRPVLIAHFQAQVAQAMRVAPDQIEPQQPLVSLGMDSLMAVELQHRLQTDLGVIMSAVDLLEGLTIAQLADQVIRCLTTPAPSAPPAPTVRAAPVSRPPPIQPVARPKNQDLLLSFEQERLWLLDQLSPGNPAYHIPLAVRLTGQLDVDALAQSLNAVVARHESLRTTFAAVSGRPHQVIAPGLTVPLPLLDLRDVPAAGREAVAQQRLMEEVQRPFDLAQGPLIRALLLRLTDTEHIALWTVHHIVSDVWSMTVLLGEMAALYRAFVGGQPAALPALPFQYADFVHWQRAWLQKEVLAEPLTYWQRQLADAPTEPMLPTDQPRPRVQRFQGDYQSFTLPPDLSTSLGDLSRETGATLFMTLLAAFKVLLYRYSGQQDLLIGSPVSGRTRPGMEKLIGFFAYPVVLRTDLSGDPTFRELLARVRQVALDAYAHQAAPFARVMAVTHPRRQTQHHPLFQIMFGFLDRPLDKHTFSGLTLTPVDVGKGATDFDLFLTVLREETGLHGLLEYNTDLLKADTVAQLVAGYSDLLTQCVQTADKRLSQFALPEALEARAEAVRATQARQEEQGIAIAATFTAEPVEDALAFWMQELDMPSRIAFAPYNQVFQQLLEPHSLLARNEQGVNVILIRFEDWLRYASNDQAESGPPATAASKVERNVQDLIQALQTATARSVTPHLLCLCPASPPALADGQLATLLDRMTALLAEELADVPGVYLVTPDDLNSLYPVAEYHDAYADELGHVPYTPALFTALGTLIARRIYAIQSQPYKVIVLDCDQTLWRGVCGEDGPLGVEIDAPHRALQVFMTAQHEAGMLLCLCSKNVESDVWAVFDHHPDMPLRREHLVSWRINWQPKSENLKSLARELDLGLDSFILLDNNPVECAEVQANCPEVLVLQLPQDAGHIPRFLQHVWAFDHIKVTDLDRQRTLLYKQNAERKRFAGDSLTFDDFLAGLELEIEMTELTLSTLPRVAQLTQRTNQFNMTTIRRSEREIQNLCLAGDAECLVVEVRDRFGDYGLVGVMILTAHDEAIKVDTFLLSCRTLGRGVEHQMLARLGEIARQRDCNRVDVVYRPTPKNQPALNFLEEVGSQFKRPADDGLLFEFPAEFAARLTHRSRASESAQ